MNDGRAAVLQGTLELLIMKALTLGDTHGWGIALRLQELSRGRFDVNQGSIYPALQRMKSRGWVSSEWRTTENNRRARYYALTRAGRRQMAVHQQEWEQTAAAVAWILEAES